MKVEEEGKRKHKRRGGIRERDKERVCEQRRMSKREK